MVLVEMGEYGRTHVTRCVTEAAIRAQCFFRVDLEGARRSYSTLVIPPGK